MVIFFAFVVVLFVVNEFPAFFAEVVVVVVVVVDFVVVVVAFVVVRFAIVVFSVSFISCGSFKMVPPVTTTDPTFSRA